MVIAARSERCGLCASRRSASAQAPELVGCLDCGLVRRSDALAQPVTEIYDDSYFCDDGSYTAYFGRAEQWRFEARRRLRWLLAAARPRRLLEVGCAGGFFLEAASRAGIEVHGVELTHVAAAYARRELGLSVTEGAFESVELAAGSYDAVCAFHVLEHAVDPVEFLWKARSLLAAGGRLALEVPNIDSVRARREGVAWAGLVPEHHLWHFAPATLARLLERTGFVPVRSDTVFPRYYFRPTRRLTRPGLAHLYHDWRGTRSPRSVHPWAGDILRFLARSR